MFLLGSTTLLRSQIVRLVGNVVAQLHLECGTEQLAVRHGCCRVPHLDNMKLSFGRERDPHDCLIVLGQQFACNAVNHTIQEDGIGLGGIDLLGPCAALVILGRIPQGTNALFHKEEHA